MKLSTMIGTVAIVFIAGTALAYDTTTMSHLKPYGTTKLSVKIPEGKSAVEVWGTNNETISCTFYDPGTGNIAYQASNVGRCIGRADLSLPLVMPMKISTPENKEIDLRVWVHDDK